MGLDQDASTAVFQSRFELNLAMISRIKLGQYITVKQFQRPLDLMAALSNVVPFGLLHMRQLQ